EDRRVRAALVFCYLCIPLSAPALSVFDLPPPASIYTLSLHDALPICTIFFYLQIWQVTGMRTFRVIKAVLSIGRIEMFTSRFKIGWIAYPFFVDMKPVLSRRQVPTFKI